MGTSKYFSTFRTGREIAGFVDTLKNQREDEESSISDNIPTSMDLRGNTTRNIMTSMELRGNTKYNNASTFGCNPHIAGEGALRSKIFLFQGFLRKWWVNRSEIWKGIEFTKSEELLSSHTTVDCTKGRVSKCKLYFLIPHNELDYILDKYNQDTETLAQYKPQSENLEELSLYHVWLIRSTTTRLFGNADS